MGFKSDLFGLAAHFFDKTHFRPEPVTFGVFFQHGNQNARGMPGFRGCKDMVQHLLAKTFTAMSGIYQQKADIGIIGVGKSEGDLGNHYLGALVLQVYLRFDYVHARIGSVPGNRAAGVMVKV